MNLTTVIFIAFGLAMDSFATSISNGIYLYKSGFRQALASASLFGLFQAIMPLLGWGLGIGFSNSIRLIDHWIAFLLLCYIGIGMLRQARSSKSEVGFNGLGFKNLFVTAFATSVDALITGVTFSVTGLTAFNDVLLSISVIFGVTVFMCFIGFYIGRFFGARLKNHALALGGALLILMGIKILLEHL